jgi:2-hydroxy-3-keto-5-methylthiopentenyl-1-phosphate phosphatase
MAPVIRLALSNLFGDEEAEAIDIIANDVKTEANGSWQIQFRHPTRFKLHSQAREHLN